MNCVDAIVCLGSFLCCWYASSISMAARVDRAISICDGVEVCLRCVVSRELMLSQVFGVVFAPLVLFVFLVYWPSRSHPPPIGRQGVLRVYPRI